MPLSGVYTCVKAWDMPPRRGQKEAAAAGMNEWRNGKFSAIVQPLPIIAAALAGNSFGRVTMLNVIAGHLIEQALTALLYFVFLFVIAASMLTAEGQPFSRTRFCLQRCSSLCWFFSLSTIFSLGHRQAIGLCGQ